MINTLERLFIAVVGAVSLVLVYGMLSMAWAGCTWEKQPGCAAEEAQLPYYYQLVCGPTPNHKVHGCGGFKTEAECTEAGRHTPGVGYWKCVKEETREHN